LRSPLTVTTSSFVRAQTWGTLRGTIRSSASTPASATGSRDDCYLLRRHLAAAIEDLERAARYARDAADRAQEAESLEYVLWAPTPAEEALERVEELRSPAQGNRRLEVDLLRTRGHI
jgi:hypothetical protein